MRIKPDLLTRIAEDTVSKYVKENSSTQAAYLHGSLLTENPILGDATDIDIVFVHFGEFRREIVRISDEITLDLEFHPHKWYQSPRDLRTKPWLGHTMYSCKALYDDNHLIDFVQASVRGLFEHPENVVIRADHFFSQARQYWMQNNFHAPEFGAEFILSFLGALRDVANGLACLSTGPLSERRFLLHFPEILKDLGSPELFVGFLELSGLSGKTAETLNTWLPWWEEAFDQNAVSGVTIPELAASRKAYYLNGARALLEGEIPLAAGWLMLNTWGQAISSLPESTIPRKQWEEVMTELGLNQENLANKIQQFDTYLDAAEDVYDRWKSTHGMG